ncbi:hypothetical protein DFH06DRAFT_1258383 [Mycena polygramma]|nr:hypothetical protein DFH06DRAFT_1258383 [Mycena polygramma]
MQMRPTRYSLIISYFLPVRAGANTISDVDSRSIYPPESKSESITLEFSEQRREHFYALAEQNEWTENMNMNY